MLFLIINYSLLAQVGIGTTTPDSSSILDIKSTESGLLIARMTKMQRDLIASSFQTDNKAGFYFFDGTNWVSIKATKKLMN